MYFFIMQYSLINAMHYYFIYFIKTYFAWGTKLSVNTVFQFGPGVKHNTLKIEQYIKHNYYNKDYCHKKVKIKINIKRTRPAGNK